MAREGWRMRRLVGLWISVILGLLVLVGAAAAQEGTPTPTSTQTPSGDAADSGDVEQVEFSARDYAFSGPDSVTSGLVKFTLTNEGEEPHHLQLVQLPPGMTAEDFINVMQEGGEGPSSSGGADGPPPPTLVEAGGPGTAMPGATSNATVDLEPGTYLMACFVPNAEGVPHAALGMVGELQVTAPEEPELSADTTLRLFDFNFEASEPVESGELTFYVVNDGPQAHEAALVQLVPGASIGEFLSAFGPNPPAGPPPGQFVGGIQSLTAGRVGYFTAEFESGDYAWVCFVPDSETGQPHFTLEMVQEFTVE
jgi:hypothetical protein